MVSTGIDRRLVEVIQDGLPISERPYDVIARRLGIDEATVISRIEALQSRGVIKRFGVVVKHRALGFRANAMVVWDIDDAEVSEVGKRMAGFEAVSLCYRRPRRAPAWPYNLFCMIHGRDRSLVREQVRLVSAELGLDHVPRAVLFSNRCFKQRGARYVRGPRRIGDRPGGTNE